MQSSVNFYKDKPIFGLDIGHNTLKVMQSDYSRDKFSVIGYGISGFPSEAIKDGIIKDFETLAKAANNLFDNHVVGKITSRRVAMSIPAAKTYARTIVLPLLKNKEIDDAVKTEAEQYIPIAIEDLYVDYTIISRNEQGIEVLAVGAPKKIIDSYINFAKVLGLEPVGFDTSILSASRLFQKQDQHSNIPAILIDFGSISTDITVHDKTVILTSTLSKGGDMFTETIAKTLNISDQEAHIVKTKYGIGKSKKQNEIVNALRPILDQMVKEIQRMIRYYEERSGTTDKIGQIVSMGGGANMPGLSEYLTSSLRLPVRTCEPFQNLSLNKLRIPSTLERSIYVTCAGLSLIEPKELFS